MSRLIRPLLTVALVAVAFVSPDPAGAAGEVEVTMAAGQFVPAIIEVPAGSSLTFVNQDFTNYPLLIGNHNTIPRTSRRSAGEHTARAGATS